MIFWFFHTRDEHARQVETVLKILDRFNFKLQMRKCKWFQPQVVFLGFVVNSSGIRPDPRKIAAVTEREYPTTITDVRSFLNAAGYLRHFIAHFVALASPLYDLTKGSPKPGTPITFRNEHRHAFEQIKSALTSPPVLKSIQFGRPVIIDTDASNACVGAVLSQPFVNPVSGRSELHPIAYESHKLTDTQRRYSAQEKELCAIVFALQTWSTWVEGSVGHHNKKWPPLPFWNPR